MLNQFYLNKDYYFEINGNEFARFSSSSACFAWALKSP